MGFQDYINYYQSLLDSELEQALALSHDALSSFYGMMWYHMGWVDAQLRPAQGPQGKRLRPVFCLLCCEAAGGRADDALPAAAAVELLHNFSLIHDDIEDNSPMRRHRETVWHLWGMPHGINCGDAMFAISMLTLSKLQERGVPAQRALSAQRAFVETCVALTEGQYLDMCFEERMDVGVDEYLQMIRNKTAALIGCSTRLGALIGGADPDATDSYARFGENLGMAFQVIDDILGIWGQESQTGKSASSDILARKKTMPVVFALGDRDLRAIYAQDTLSQGDVERAVGIMDRMRARQYAEQVARDYAAKAMAYLDAAGSESPAGQALCELGQWLLERDF